MPESCEDHEMVTGWGRGAGLLFKINNPFYGTYIIKNKQLADSALFLRFQTKSKVVYRI